MRWKPHVRFGGRAGETDRWRQRHGAPVRSHLANTKLDECRRRVQNETLGHRGYKSDPLYRSRRLLTKAKERLGETGHEKLVGLLRAGDPNGDVATVWEAKEAVRELYAHADADLALEWVTQLGRDLQDKDYPVEARSLGRTLIRWRH
jgi:transposase